MLKDVEAILASLQHKHDYKEIAVCDLTHKVQMGFATVNQAATGVLHRCTGCGNKFVQELTGTWTLEEVRGQGD